MKKILLLASAVVLLVGCSKSEAPAEFPQPAGDKQIQATSTVEGVASKALIAGDVQLSGLTFLRLDDAATDKTSGFNFSTATAVTGSSRAGGGVISFGSAQTYDRTGGKTAYLRGFTTDKATVNAGTSTVWTIDGATDILLTDVWNAGRHSAPVTTGMKFCHQLSRVEVICQGEAGVAAGVVRAAWGDVESIKLVDASPELTYTYATDAVTASGTAADFALLKGDEYDASKPFETVAIEANGGTTVCGAAMVFPQTTTVKLKVKTANKPEKEISTTLGKLDRANTHKITLTFNTDGVSVDCQSSAIEGWSEGTSGSGTVTGK